MFGEMYKENKGIIKEIVGKIHKNYPRLEYEDVYQNALIGLMVALEKYEEGKGVKFSTYAYKTVYGYALRTYYRDSWYTRNEYNNKTKLYDRVSNNHLYLEEKSGNNEDYETFLEMTIGVENEEEKIANKIMLEQGLKKLTKEECGIIRNRYFEDKTYREIGDGINKTPQYVKHREKKALEKLRRVLKND